MGDAEQVIIKVHRSINDISAEAWNICAGETNPFISHEFLAAVENSGSATPETGWGAYHLTLEDDQGKILGAVPMYLKSHSQGEYIFDHSWADAFERAGGRYYPKLLVAAPFSPVTGPRLLVRPGTATEEIRAHLLAGCITVARRINVSSLHVNFASQDEIKALERHGMLIRNSQQFHWQNNGYQSFDDFLNDLSSRKRKNVRKERREAVSPGITIEALNGADLREEHWDAFFEFYIDTAARKWGRPYLTRKFFSLIGETMADKVVLILCRREGRYIAGALNFVGSDALFGRNWGCIEDHRFLHFETCYYQAIEYAINHGLQRVEAGAQGAHKLARGYLPQLTYSAHWVDDPGFRQALERFLVEERAYVNEDVLLLSEHAPFREDRQD